MKSIVEIIMKTVSSRMADDNIMQDLRFASPRIMIRSRTAEPIECKYVNNRSCSHEVSKTLLDKHMHEMFKVLHEKHDIGYTLATGQVRDFTRVFVATVNCHYLVFR